MHTVGMPATSAMADRIAAVGKSMSPRQQNILNNLVEEGRTRLALYGHNNLTSGEVSEIFSAKAQSTGDKKTRWQFGWFKDF